ncbi:Tim10/DDP family zinc finger [Ancylostoma caninum]|uniref:Mitochondrial import inner membrane translocase subunit n=1 Tax=Ancylostoma caninum TaxID=29170 RepID=A0A368F2P5_ANCCA|nr:Tim10/DDP family zinc finger [Ancylostoma caninum]
MFSLGGLFVLWLIDVVLIALQLLQPADGSRYIMNYYGPRVSPLRKEISQKGEAVCLDRCVAKYLDVHEKLGKRLTTMSQNDEAALQKMSQQGS